MNTLSSDYSKTGIPLSEATNLPASAVILLQKLWITTVEEFVVAAQDETEINGLAEVLGSTPQDVKALAEDLLPLLPQEIRMQISAPRPAYALGAWDEPGPPQDEMADLGLDLPPDLPPRTSWVNRLPPVRQQGGRGTCVAHACTALREFLLDDPNVDLSEQFVYWAARQKLITPILNNRPGALLLYGLQALHDYGVCLEEDWPYCPDPAPGDEEQGTPSTSIIERASSRRVSSFTFVWPRNIYRLKACLAASQAVAFTVPTFGFWNAQSIQRSGAVRLPMNSDGVHNPLTWLESAHALLMAGYQDDPDTPGGGYFIFRNSWGSGWGQQCPDGAGYGWIPYEYLQKFGLTAFTAD